MCWALWFIGLRGKWKFEASIFFIWGNEELSNTSKYGRWL